jgi:hypothetical protein
MTLRMIEESSCAARSLLPEFEVELFASPNVILTDHMSDLTTDNGYHSAMINAHWEGQLHIAVSASLVNRLRQVATEMLILQYM